MAGQVLGGHQPVQTGPEPRDAFLRPVGEDIQLLGLVTLAAVRILRGSSTLDVKTILARFDIEQMIVNVEGTILRGIAGGAP